MSTINEIIEGVAMATGWSTDEINSKSRLRDLVLVRQICYYIAYKDEGHTFTSIGKSIGGRDHTTVLHGVNKIMDYYKTKDPLFTQYMEAIRMKASHIHSTIMPIISKHSSELCNYSRFKITRHC